MSFVNMEEKINQELAAEMNEDLRTFQAENTINLSYVQLD